MSLRWVLFFALVVTSLAVQGRSLDVNLNNDTAQFNLSIFPAGSTRFGETQVDVGFLYTTDDDFIGSVGLIVTGQTGSGSPGLDAGVGLRLFGGNTEKNNDFLSVSLSGLLSYSPPTLDRMKVGVYIDYSPRIVTFMDGGGFLHYGVRFGYQILQQAQVYMGYRNMELDVPDKADDSISEGAFIGMVFDF